jgi:hypothetical protein
VRIWPCLTDVDSRLTTGISERRIEKTLRERRACFGQRAIPEPLPEFPEPVFGPLMAPLGFALLGGPELAFPFALEGPSLGPLLPVVLPFIELPVVVELAACPPEVELPPAELPAPEPPLCA